jgi:DNA-binding protein H-NS
MPTPDLDSMSHEELTALRKSIDTALKIFGERRRRAAMDEVGAVLKKHDMSLADLLSNGKAAKKPMLRAARYRHPENPDVTWSGQGRQPGWFRDAVARGVAKEDMAALAIALP